MMSAKRLFSALALNTAILLSAQPAAAQATSQTPVSKNASEQTEPVTTAAPRELTEDQKQAIIKQLEENSQSPLIVEWYSDKAALKTHPERRHFLSELQKDYQHLQLPETAQVLILSRPAGADKNLPEIDYVSSEIVGRDIPLIEFRKDMFGGPGSLFPEPEALATAAHEEKHIQEWLKRGDTLPQPDPTNPFLPQAEQERIYKENLAIAANARAEEKSCDKNAVSVGRGEAFLSALGKVMPIVIADFDADQRASFPPSDRISYEEAAHSPIFPHVEFMQRRADIVAEIKEKKQPAPSAPALKSPKIF